MTQHSTALHRLLVACLWVLLALPTTSLRAAGKPEPAPVTVDTLSPTGAARPGDVVDTDIRLRALEDLDRLAVDVAPFFGVQVISGAITSVLTDLKVGDVRIVTVKVKLLEKQGSLGVTFSTIKAANKDTAGGAVTIEYGSRQ